MIVNWEPYRKCKVCYAPLGTACKNLTFAKADGVPVVTGATDAVKPHTGRELRAGYGR